ncbi:hypothetical protein ACIQVT_14070 [Streptomyces sp. NPDC100445]|uniref:hypothetical protein n=1 Tax=Streptomyces sp. NPDC100445 TaxID=3366102 RepID=UPI0037FDED49
MNHGDEQSYTDYGDTGQTRTRLPENDPYGGAPRRPHRSSSRSLVTVVGVVVLLIAAIAFANKNNNTHTDDTATTKGSRPQTSTTAPTGTHPVGTRTAGIPSGFPRTEQGAQSAAANYASVLGSDGMFNASRRHEIVQTIADPSTVSRLQAGFDADYSASFLRKVGLDDNGTAPKGSTFVNRTVPVGTKTTALSERAATVEVWCNGLFGLADDASTNPVTSNWFTVTMKLSWDSGDWKVRETTQRTGPTPVAGDNPVSGAGDISRAVQEFGGFTYAR